MILLRVLAIFPAAVVKISYTCRAQFAYIGLPVTRFTTIIGWLYLGINLVISVTFYIALIIGWVQYQDSLQP